jgi:hypothetical protein
LTSRRIRRSSHAAGVSCAQPRQHGRDRVAVADDDTIDAAHLAGLSRDLQPPCGPDQRQRRLGSGAGHLQRHRATRLGERAVGQEGTAPGGDGIAHRAPDDLGRQPADGTTALVDQAGLSR